MKKFGAKSFKACGCGKKSCKICTIPDNATKLIFHTTNKKKTYTLKPTSKEIRYFLKFNDCHFSSGWQISKVKDVKLFNREKSFDSTETTYLEINKKQYNYLLKIIKRNFK